MQPPSALAGAAGRAGRDGREGMALRLPGRAGSVGMAVLRGAFASAAPAAGTPLGALSASGAFCASPCSFSIVSSLLSSLTSSFTSFSAGHINNLQGRPSIADRRYINSSSRLFAFCRDAFCDGYSRRGCCCVACALVATVLAGALCGASSAPSMARLSIASTLMGDTGSCELVK